MYNNYRYYANQIEAAAAHSSLDHECEKLQDCPYKGTQLLDKRNWPGGDGQRDSGDEQETISCCKIRSCNIL